MERWAAASSVKRTAKIISAIAIRRAGLELTLEFHTSILDHTPSLAPKSLLVDEYAREATPTKLLEAYLRVFTSGNFRSWKASAYANKAALLGAPGRGVVLQDLYTTFGAEGAMHCWTAIMLRRRIVVYSKPEASAETQRFVRALPQLAWQRGPDVGIVVPGSVSI